MSASVLTAEFLAERGVQVVRPLRDWLARAAFVAKTRSSAEEKARYERWALHTVEQALRDEGNGDAAAVQWARLSPIMPANAPDCTPALLAGSTTSQNSGNSGESGEAAQRDALLQETLRRAPLELRTFVTQAFALYDKDVAQHKRSYARVTFLEMLNIAKNLHRLSEKQRQLRAAAALDVLHNSSTASRTAAAAASTLQPRIVQPPLPLGQQAAAAPTRFLQPPPQQQQPQYIQPPQQQQPQYIQPPQQKQQQPQYIQPPQQQQPQYIQPAQQQQQQPQYIRPPQQQQPQYLQPPPQQQQQPQYIQPPQQQQQQQQQQAVNMKRLRSRSRSSELDDDDDGRTAAAAASDADFFVQLARTRHCSATDDDVDGGSAAPSHGAGVGRSQALERVYSRYEPNMDDIRPLPVLVRAFAHVQRRAAARERDDGRAAALKYLSEQLKGMRQDLHVQHIANAFAVRVYESHARLCLETRELGEFNQCQATLKQLYARVAAQGNTKDDVGDDNDGGGEDDDGNSNSSKDALCNAAEFFYYRLVYLWLSEQHDALSTELIHYSNAHRRRERQRGSSSNKDNTNSSNNMATRTSTLTMTSTAVAAAAATRSGVQKTLLLCRACDEGDAAALCRALVYFRREMRLLVAMYVQRLRVRWLRTLLCAMRGSVSMRFVMASLGFTPTRVVTTAPMTTTAAAAAAVHKSRRNSDSDGELVWLDGSRDDARREFAALLALLKVQPPHGFDFDDELARDARRDGGEGSGSRNAATAVPSLDAVAARQLVEAYVTFLGTRSDAALDTAAVDSGNNNGNSGSSDGRRHARHH